MNQEVEEYSQTVSDYSSGMMFLKMKFSNNDKKTDTNDSDYQQV